MIDQIITRELFEQSLINGFKMLFDAVMPVVSPLIIPAIIGTVSVGIVKSIAGSVVYDLSILTGYSRRQAKRKAEKARNVVDLVSTTSDVHNSVNRRGSG